jgi:hypothetical protein
MPPAVCIPDTVAQEFRKNTPEKIRDAAKTARAELFPDGSANLDQLIAQFGNWGLQLAMRHPAPGFPLGDGSAPGDPRTGASRHTRCLPLFPHRCLCPLTVPSPAQPRSSTYS